jgi:hypothetical protein
MYAHMYAHQISLGGSISQSGTVCPGINPTLGSDYKIVEPETPPYISWE